MVVCLLECQGLLEFGPREPYFRTKHQPVIPGGALRMAEHKSMLSSYGIKNTTDYRTVLASWRSTNIQHSHQKKETSHSLLDSFMCSDHQSTPYSLGQHTEAASAQAPTLAAWLYIDSPTCKTGRALETGMCGSTCVWGCRDTTITICFSMSNVFLRAMVSQKTEHNWMGGRKESCLSLPTWLRVLFAKINTDINCCHTCG